MLARSNDIMNRYYLTELTYLYIFLELKSINYYIIYMKKNIYGDRNILVREYKIIMKQIKIVN